MKAVRPIKCLSVWILLFPLLGRVDPDCHAPYFLPLSSGARGLNGLKFTVLGRSVGGVPFLPQDASSSHGVLSINNVQKENAWCLFSGVKC